MKDVLLERPLLPPAARVYYIPDMSPGPVARLVRATFILLITSGGGELPALDGMLFHSDQGAPATITSHFEASGGCHADLCTIRATAQHPPLTTALVEEALRASEPAGVPPRFLPGEVPAFPILQPFSRAPPRLQV